MSDTKLPRDYEVLAQEFDDLMREAIDNCNYDLEEAILLFNQWTSSLEETISSLENEIDEINDFDEDEDNEDEDEDDFDEDEINDFVEDED